MGVGRWWSKAPLRLRSILRRGRVERELDEELQFHLEHKIEEGIAAGLSPQEARFAALRAMGGLEQRKEEIRDTRGIHWLTDFVDDVRYAVRSLRRAPGADGVRGDDAGARHRHDVGDLQHGGRADLPALPRAASAQCRHAREHLARQRLRPLLLPRIPRHPRATRRATTA